MRFSWCDHCAGRAHVCDEIVPLVAFGFFRRLVPESRQLVVSDNDRMLT